MVKAMFHLTGSFHFRTHRGGLPVFSVSCLAVTPVVVESQHGNMAVCILSQ